MFALFAPTLIVPNMLLVANRNAPYRSQVAFRGRGLILNDHVFNVVVNVGKLLDPFVTLPAECRYTIDKSPVGPGYFARIIYILPVIHDGRTMHDGVSSNRPYLCAHHSSRLHS